VRSSTRRTLLWVFASTGALAAVVAAYAIGSDDGGGDDDRTAAVATSDPAPRLPDDVGEGCGTPALTDPDNLDASRPVARCAAGAPTPQPLAETAHLRVALTQRVPPSIRWPRRPHRAVCRSTTSTSWPRPEMTPWIAFSTGSWRPPGWTNRPGRGWPTPTGLHPPSRCPTTEPIDGTMLAGRLLGAERDVGLAYARAVIRTINTYMSGDYHDDAEVMGALAEATGTGAEELAGTPSLLFDWEIRSGTTGRLQDAVIEIGAEGYERPLPERKLVDGTLAVDAPGLRGR
jgi:hypothetical protein